MSEGEGATMPDDIFRRQINFGGSSTAKDAEAIREFGRRVRASTITPLFPDTDKFLFGPGPVQRRVEAIQSNPIGGAAEIYGPKALLSGRAKQIAAKYVAGILEGVEAEEATTGEGLLRITEAILTPPDPQQFGVARNFYLPEGVTDFVPLVDRIRIIGVAEQRADDRRAALQRLQGQMERKTTQQLLDILTQSTNEAVNERINARMSPRVTQQEFFDAAGFELQARFRAQPVPLGVLPVGAPAGAGTSPLQLVPVEIATGATPVRRGPLDPFGAPVAMGSVQPSTIHPVTGAALRNQDAARGIRRELVHDRADP